MALTSTTCCLGGLHWWWRCPETERRCAKLYLPNGGRRFLGRAAYGLAYTVGKLMRRDVRTVRTDTRISAFQGEFPLGSAARVVAVDEADRYAGTVSVVEAHAPEVDATETVAALLRLRDQALLPAMDAKGAMALFEAAEAEELAVVDGAKTRRVIGLLTEKHLLRRYGEELDKRRHEEAGLAWGPGAGG